MKNKEGIYISRMTIRLIKLTVVGLIVAAIAAQAPEITRYIKTETM